MKIRGLVVALALVCVMLFSACGVAHFGDSSSISGSAASMEVSSQSEYSLVWETQQAINQQHTDLVAAYNAGVAEFISAQDAGHTISEDLADAYNNLAGVIEGHKETMMADISTMTEQEAEQFSRQMDGALQQVEDLRQQLATSIGG